MEDVQSDLMENKKRGKSHIGNILEGAKVIILLSSHNFKNPYCLITQWFELTVLKLAFWEADKNEWFGVSVLQILQEEKHVSKEEE